MSTQSVFKNDPPSPAEGSESCPPSPRPSHCIILTMTNPTPARIEDFTRRAAADDIKVVKDGDLLVAYLSDEKIQSVFGGKVVYQETEPSASNAGQGEALCTAYLEGTAVPARYAPYLSAIAIGHQICE